MAATLAEISTFLSEELDLNGFTDSSVNGIQVEGNPEVKKICVAVDAGLSVIESAARLNGDFLLVHHGMYWGATGPVVGVHKKALEILIAKNITVFAAHIPLDAHPVYGNNFCLARYLGLTDLIPCLDYNGRKIGVKGLNSEKLSSADFEARLQLLPGGNAPILTFNFGPNPPQKVAICSGAAADELYKYKVENFDTLITGEPRQFAYHYCQERGLNAIFGGHYRTETLGVRAIGERLSELFNVSCEFIDMPTGV